MSFSHHFTRRRALGTLGGLIGSGACSAGWAFLIEPNQLSVNHFTIPLNFLPESLDGLRVGQLTDFHYHPDQDDSLITDVVETTNALDLDLIFLTGDFIDSDVSTFPPLAKHFANLKAKHGIYAVLGNHDGWARGSSTPHIIEKELRKIGIELLINQNSIIQVHNTPLAIAGTHYVWHGVPNPQRTFKGIADDIPTLALVHEPDYYDTMRQYRKEFLQFSGHTHGGQCQVPFTGYAPVSVKYGKNYNYGLFEEAQSKLFVSRGVGTTGIRVRFACSPELAVLTLKSEIPSA